MTSEHKISRDFIVVAALLIYRNDVTATLNFI